MRFVFNGIILALMDPSTFQSIKELILMLASNLLWKLHTAHTQNLCFIVIPTTRCLGFFICVVFCPATPQFLIVSYFQQALQGWKAIQTIGVLIILRRTVQWIIENLDLYLVSHLDLVGRER